MASVFARLETTVLGTIEHMAAGYDAFGDNCTGRAALNELCERLGLTLNEERISKEASEMEGSFPMPTHRKA